MVSILCLFYSLSDAVSQEKRVLRYLTYSAETRERRGGNICYEREKEIRGKRDELQQANKAERGDEVAMRKK